MLSSVTPWLDCLWEMADLLGFLLFVHLVHSLEKPAVSMDGTGQQHTCCPLQHRLLSLCPSQTLLLLLFLSADRNARCFPFNNLDAKLENVNYA